MHARDDRNYCLPLAIQSRKLKIIPIYQNLQIENFAGIHTHRKPNLDHKISIPAHVITRNNYKKNDYVMI